MEQFLVPLILDDIKSSIDVRQYGNMRGSSTSHYLVRLIHDLLSQLDHADMLFSVIMYDFKKGFDLIDHTTVIKKLLDMDLRPAYARWVSSFLQDRQQRVKMPDGTLSSWKRITCGTPQGTLIGPVAFLAMVYDAASEAQNRLKYVDDLTIYQACSVDGIDEEKRLQEMTNQLCEWANENKMVLNTDKCQIMHFFTAKKPIVLPDITTQWWTEQSYLASPYLHLFRPEFKKIKTNFKKIKSNFKKMKTNFKKIKSNFKKMKTNFKNLKPNFKNIKSNFRKIESIFKLVCIHKIVNIITISSVNIYLQITCSVMWRCTGGNEAILHQPK